MYYEEKWLNLLDALSVKANDALRRQAQASGRPNVIRLDNLEFINETIRAIVQRRCLIRKKVKKVMPLLQK